MYQERPTRKFGRLPLLKSLPCFLDGPTPIVQQTVELGATKSCEVGFGMPTFPSKYPRASILPLCKSLRQHFVLFLHLHTGDTIVWRHRREGIGFR